MKSQVLIIQVTYDEEQHDAPSKWDWPALLDVLPEHVNVLLTGVLAKDGDT